MVKNIALDTVTLQEANLWVDVATAKIHLEVRYSLTASVAGFTVSKSREVGELLTAEEQAAILKLATRLKGMLEQEELS